MRFLFCVAALLVSTQAMALNLSLTGNAQKFFEKDDKSYGESVGISIGQGLYKGVGLWSWTGTGLVHKPEGDSSQWISHTQGIDFQIMPRLKITVKGTYNRDVENQTDDYSVGAGFSLKIM